MKVIFFILGLIVGLMLQKPAHAVQFDIAIGQTRFQQSNDTDWWQTGPASEGFSNDFNLKSTSYRIGISDNLTRNVRWTAGYANLGNVSSRAVATNYDEEYDAVHQRCVSSGCEMVTYSGKGSVDGYYLTIAPETKVLGVTVYGEVGAWVYFPKFSMTKSHDSGYVYQVPVKNGTETGPVLGFGLRVENMTLAARFYKVDHNGQLPAIYQGFASEVSLGWIF